MVLIIKLLQNFILDLGPMAERTRGQDVEMSRDGEKAKVLKGIGPLGTRDVVCGQFRGDRNEPGVRAILSGNLCGAQT